MLKLAHMYNDPLIIFKHQNPSGLYKSFALVEKMNYFVLAS